MKQTALGGMPVIQETAHPEGTNEKSVLVGVHALDLTHVVALGICLLLICSLRPVRSE